MSNISDQIFELAKNSASKYFSHPELDDILKNKSLIKLLENLTNSKVIVKKDRFNFIDRGVYLDITSSSGSKFDVDFLPKDPYLDIHDEANHKLYRKAPLSLTVHDVGDTIVSVVDLIKPPIKIIGLGNGVSPSRGTRYSPNSYNEPTYYKVLGTGLGQHTTEEYNAILEWLKKHDPKKVPTKDPVYSNYGSSNLWRIEFKNKEWFVVDYYSYTGG